MTSDGSPPMNENDDIRRAELSSIIEALRERIAALEANDVVTDLRQRLDEIERRLTALEATRRKRR
jgi:polyhydroxyalkanoate synthesis regulator phasin